MDLFSKICGLIVLACALAILFSFPVMLLWNALCPEIFGLPEISWLQALGLMILSGFLIGRGSSGKSSS